GKGEDDLDPFRAAHPGTMCDSTTEATPASCCPFRLIAFEPSQRLASLREVWIDPQRALEPPSGPFFQPDPLAIVADSEQRPGIHIEDVGFKGVEVDGGKRRRMTTREQSLVFGNHIVEANRFRFGFDRYQQATLSRPIILIQTLIVAPYGSGDANRSLSVS